MSTQIESVGGELFVNGQNYTPLGVNQTWQDFTAIRLSGTLHTNGTGRTIVVMLRVATTSNQNAYIAGNLVFTSPANSANTSIVLHVPPGDTYQYGDATNASFLTWFELRGV